MTATPPANLPRPFLQFFFVEIGFGFFDLHPSAGRYDSSISFLSILCHRRSFVLSFVDSKRRDAHGRDHRNIHGIRACLPTSSVMNCRTGNDRYVLQHFLAAITEPRRFHRENIKDAAQLVHHECRKRLAFHVFTQ
jgi:hypothetical protein